MRYLRSFGRFWWDFVVGDDWRLAAGVAVVARAHRAARAQGVDAWWLLPSRSRSCSPNRSVVPFEADEAARSPLGGITR